MAVGTFTKPTSLAQIFLLSLSEVQSNRQLAIKVDKKVLVVWGRTFDKEDGLAK